jgi:polysaccharide biosynthesis transport protein
MPANKSPDFDIRHYWGIILKKKHIALAIAFSVLSIFTLAGFILPKTYEAKSTVAVEKSSLIDPLIKGVGTSSNVESGLSNLKNNITSRNIVERVVKKLDLDASAKNPNQYEALIEGIRQKLNVTVMQPGRQQMGAGTALFTISYTDKDPKMVQNVVNTLVSEYIEESMGQRVSDAHGAYEFIKNQLEEYKVKLDESDKAIRDFRERHPHMIPQSETTLIQRIENLQTSRMEAEIKLKEQIRKKENLQKQLAGEKELTVAFVTREGSPQARLNNLNNQLITLTSKYTDSYPEVIKAKKEIEELKSQIAKERIVPADSSGSETAAINPIYQQLREDLAKTDTEVESLRARIAELSRQQYDIERRMGQMPKEQEEWTKLQRDRNVSQKIYDELLEKLENAKVSKDLEVTNKAGSFRIVDPAILPPLPVKPNRVIMILSGIFAGILAGVGTVFGLEYLKPSFKNEGSIESLLKVQVLATIPKIITEEDKLNAKKIDHRIIIAASAYLLVIGIILAEEFLYRYAGIKIINF